jgi:hypothetical protein
VLIYSGASHNFISPKVTTALGLTITPTTARSIKLGDGHKVNTDGVCKDLNMKLGEVDITCDAFGVGSRKYGYGAGSGMAEYIGKSHHGLEGNDHAILSQGSHG